MYFNLSVFKSETPSAPYFFYPPFAFYRGLYLLSDACGNLRCLQAEQIPDTEIGAIYLILVAETCIMFVLTGTRDRGGPPR